MRNDKYLTKIIAGCLLGDASICTDRRDNGNANFETTKIVDHIDYLEMLQNIINDITTSTIKKSKDADDDHIIAGIHTKRKEQHRLRTSRHPFFNTFKERFYIENKKVVDPHYMKLLDWEMMSIWYMDDGFISNTHTTKGYDSTVLGLCTNSFSYGDHLVLKNAIKEKLNVDFNIKQERNRLGNLHYRLWIARKDTAKFVYNIEKYIVPSFQYKLIIKQMSMLNDYNNISRTENPLEIKGDEIV